MYRRIYNSVLAIHKANDYRWSCIQFVIGEKSQHAHVVACQDVIHNCMIFKSRKYLNLLCNPPFWTKNFEHLGKKDQNISPKSVSKDVTSPAIKSALHNLKRQMKDYQFKPLISIFSYQFKPLILFIQKAQLFIFLVLFLIASLLPDI